MKNKVKIDKKFISEMKQSQEKEHAKMLGKAIAKIDRKQRIKARREAMERGDFTHIKPRLTKAEKERLVEIVLGEADKARERVSEYNSAKRKNLLNHANAVAKPHTEVIEGYGVLNHSPIGSFLLHGSGMDPFFRREKRMAVALADEWRQLSDVPVSVVKLKAEFTVV